MSAEPATHSSRGQKLAWQCNSNNVCTNHAPYHICDSKGHVPRFSGHQSRISMHDGPKNQMCNFYFNCMQTKQTHKGAKPLSWLGQEVEHACLCDAILDMSTSMQSCQCKGAYKLTNIQGMKHQCQPSSMQGVMWVSKHANKHVTSFNHVSPNMHLLTNTLQHSRSICKQQEDGLAHRLGSSK